MKNIFNEIKSTIVGLILIGSSLYFELETLVRLVLLGLGIVLLFAKDQLPGIIKNVVNKFVIKKE